MHFLEGIVSVSVRLVLSNTVCSVSCIVSGFHFLQYIWHHMLCYLPNIYNYIMLTSSLEEV